MRVPIMDQVLLGTALAAAVGSFAWYGWLAHAHGKGHRHAPLKAQPTSRYVMGEGAGAVPSPAKWLPPAAQSRGPEWIYDMFTPPEIYYDAERRQFAVFRPHATSGTQASGLELLAVQRMPFRLQLVGYVGDGARSLGTFENERTGEVFLAGAGRPVPSLGLTITDFTVERRPVALADRLPSNQRVAIAVVRDERTGENTRLTTGEQSYTDELRAVLAADDDDDVRHELRAGDEVKGGEQSYVLERLQLDPPAVELSQIAPAASATPIHLNLTSQTSGEPLAAKPAN